ncbi:MAG: hypothetical protein KAT71_03750 [Gammaproteobacteria bacterium]|nr:hypothetical protein [Gammaproteobacteria bacterium]
MEEKKGIDNVKDGQYWVMGNISAGTEWDYSFWENKFGKPIKLKPDSDGMRNPNIISIFYFKSIDMSIIVNKLTNKITTCRIGKKYN